MTITISDPADTATGRTQSPRWIGVGWVRAGVVVNAHAITGIKWHTLFRQDRAERRPAFRNATR